MNYNNSVASYSKNTLNNFSNSSDFNNDNKVKTEIESTENTYKRVEEYGRVFTGSVERVMKWHRIYPHFCYYEVIASVIALQESTIKTQRTMLLRDRKGPILQVVYYTNDRINITDFFVGQTLRCLGHMTGASTLHALSIRAATDEELSTLQRMAYICDHAIMSSLS